MGLRDIADFIAVHPERRGMSRLGRQHAGHVNLSGNGKCFYGCGNNAHVETHNSKGKKIRVCTTCVARHKLDD